MLNEFKVYVVRKTVKAEFLVLSLFLSLSTGCKVSWRVILGLTGIALIFFMAACIVLCFGFVTKTVLIANQCFCCCWEVLAEHWSFSFLLCSANEEVEAEAVQEARRGTATAAGYRSEIKAWEKKGCRDVTVVVFFLWSYYYTWWGPAFHEMNGHLPADRK